MSARFPMSQRDTAYQPRATLWVSGCTNPRVLKERRISPNGERATDRPRYGVPSERMVFVPSVPGVAPRLVCAAPLERVLSTLSRCGTLLKNSVKAPKGTLPDNDRHEPKRTGQGPLGHRRPGETDRAKAAVAGGLAGTRLIQAPGRFEQPIHRVLRLRREAEFLVGTGCG